MTDRQWTIGSALDADLHINDSVISRRHCRLSLHADQYFIEDLASRNSTFLNQKRIVKQTPVASGEKIMLAGSVLMPWPDENSALEKIRIGRATSNEVVIEDESVSANHAMLFCDPNNVWIVRDLGSTNGTRLGNGERLSSAARLTPSDVVRFGNVAETLSSLQRHAKANGRSANPVETKGTSATTVKQSSSARSEMPSPDRQTSQRLQTVLIGGALLIVLSLISLPMIWSAIFKGNQVAEAKPKVEYKEEYSDRASDDNSKLKSATISVPLVVSPATPELTDMERVRDAMFVVVAQYTGSDGSTHDIALASAWATTPDLLITNARVLSPLLPKPQIASVVHAQSGARIPIAAMGQHSDFQSRQQNLISLLKKIVEYQSAKPSSKAETEEVRTVLKQSLESLPEARSDVDAVDVGWIRVNRSSDRFSTLEIGPSPGVRAGQPFKLFNPSVFADVEYAGLQNDKSRVVQEWKLTATHPVLIQSTASPRRWIGRIQADSNDYQAFLHLGCPVVDLRGGLFGMYRGPARDTTAKASDSDPIAQLSDEFDMVPSATIAELLQQIPKGTSP